MRLPLIGLGTWQLKGRECTKVIKRALEIGYRHIDTAHVYENHKAIGKAISDFNRKELFLTSKLALDQAGNVKGALDRVLNELQTDYLDLYLLHWPDHTLPLYEIVQEMQAQKSRVKKVGVSNFTIHHLQDLLRKKVKVAANQVEFHPYLYQKKLLEFCKSKKIQLIAYRPLGKGALVKEAIFKKIGKKHQKTAAQVILRWLVQKKIPTIAKASSEKHLQENFQIFDFHLSQEEMQAIDHLNRDQRFCGSGDSEFNY